jgi:FixJ family two-component response regulator
MGMAEMPQDEAEIFIADDDPAVRKTLVMLFERSGHKVTAFAEGKSLLALARERTPACILLDVSMPGPSGLEILKELNAQDYPAPIFIISGSGDIPMAVDAIRHGALDFIEKPFSGSELVPRVRTAMQAWRERRNVRGGKPFAIQAFPGREPLTPRESEVLTAIAGGASNKEAARTLGISPRTVEVHRAKVMEKLGAKNFAELMRIVMADGRNRS